MSSTMHNRPSYRVFRKGRHRATGEIYSALATLEREKVLIGDSGECIMPAQYDRLATTSLGCNHASGRGSLGNGSIGGI